MDRPKLGSGGGKMILDLPHLTVDKREIKDFPKLRLRNFFYPQAIRRNKRLGINSFDTGLKLMDKFCPLPRPGGFDG
jgi:hypothetical protein